MKKLCHKSNKVRLGVDIGGTFTDIVLEKKTEVFSTKVLTTTDYPEIAIINGINEVAKKANVKILSWAKKKLGLPIVAIGGINSKNYKKLIKQGANYIALSSFIWDNPKLKPDKAIRVFV